MFLDFNMVTVLCHGVYVTIHDTGKTWTVVYNNGEIEKSFPKTTHSATQAAQSVAFPLSKKD